MMLPTLYDAVNFCLAGGALYLAWLRFKDGRRRSLPIITKAIHPVADQPDWQELRFTIRNLADTAVYFERIKAPWWSLARMLKPELAEAISGPPYAPSRDTNNPLPKCLAVRRLDYSCLIERDTEKSFRIFFCRSSMFVNPIFRWADSTSDFKLKIHTP